MEKKIKYTKEEFDLIFKEIESITSQQERIKYIEFVKQQYPEIFNPKKGIELFSKAQEKIIDDYRKRFLRLLDESVNRIRAAEYKKVDEVRTMEDYLLWHSSIDKLKYLIGELIDHKCLNEKKDNIERIIKGHFYVEDYTVIEDKKINRINWNNPIPDFVYLLDLLAKNKYMDQFILKKPHTVAKHFKDQYDNDMKDGYLRKTVKTFKLTEYKTDKFWIINEIISSLQNKKFS